MISSCSFLPILGLRLGADALLLRRRNHCDEDLPFISLKALPCCCSICLPLDVLLKNDEGCVAVSHSGWPKAGVGHYREPGESKGTLHDLIM
ncbi:hypothetical protein J3E68DRAFT_77003 [Trichoderma sp. SZMC 28012]